MHQGRLTGAPWGAKVAAVALALGLVASFCSVAGASGPGRGTYGSGDNFGWFSGTGYVPYQGANGEQDVNVCSMDTAPNVAYCNARVVTQPAANEASTSTPASAPVSSCPSDDPNAPSAVISGGNGGYDPCYLQSAYNVASLAEASGGAGQIVGIVDYTVDPDIASNLATYRSEFGLPSCPSGTVSSSNSGCVFEQVAQSGAPTSGTSGWDVEISLDVETVSAICPLCQILLVEANSASISALGSAVNTAVADGAIAVSNSYGASESSSETTYASEYYQHPGVAIVASSGDTAGEVEFPAVAPDVTAAGGTSLLQYSNQGTRSPNATETVWDGTPTAGDGSGAGCSKYVAAPTWQASFLASADAPSVCSKRVTADVSADADPDTGVWVYDTESEGGWLIVGGTSLASPLIASMYALAGNAAGSSAYPVATAYANASTLYHVTSGSVGTCGNYLCNAADSVDGYNGPAGLGTPGGSGSLAAFTFNPAGPPAAPSTPTNVAAAPGNDQVSLSWTAPASNGSPISGYDVYYSTTSGEALSGTEVTTSSTSVTISPLTDGTAYYFVVEAVNAVGNSGPSTQVSATPVDLTAPSAPTLDTASAASGSVTLAWSAPSSDGGAELTGYRVYEGTANPPTTELSTVIAASATGATVTGLTNGTTYYFAVVATNSVGPSSLSNVLSATPEGVPGAPTSLRASARSSTVTLSWRAPSSAGGGSLTIKEYEILQSTSSTMSSPVEHTTTGTSYSVTGLSTSTTYYFEVYAVNSAGIASASPAGPVSSRG